MRNPNENILYHYSVPAGGGKTYNLAHEAVRRAKAGEKVLICQPSKLLIEQTLADIRNIDPHVRVTRFDGDVIEGGKVIDSLTKYFKTTDTAGEIVFTTHTAFECIPYFHKKGQWHLIIDEVITAYAHFTLNLAHNHSVITEHLDVVAAGPKYGRLKANTNIMKEIVENQTNDDVYKLLTPLALRMNSPHWTAWVDMASYQELLDGKKGQLEVFFLLSPQLVLGFKRSIMASAAFKETLTYHIFKKMHLIGEKSFRFAKLSIPNSNLRYTEHENGHLIDFYYLIDRRWSKKLRNLQYQDANGAMTTVGAQSVEIIGALMGTDPFAYTTNKDGMIGFDHMANAHLLPNSPHGLNSYQWIHNFVCLSALNPTPSLESFFCEMLGMSIEQVQTAIYRSFVYQAFMRTSIRDPLDTTPKKAVILDKSTAQWLAGLFFGSRIHYLHGLSEELCAKKGGAPKKHANDADKTWSSRYNQMRQWADAVLALNAGSVIAGDVEWQAKFCYDKCLIPTVEIVTEIGLDLGTRIPHKKSRSGEALSGDASAFIDYLRLLHIRRCHTKESNFLISPTVFQEKDGVETKRGLANVAYVNGIWLDNDGGGITRAEFAALFPQIEMHIWNTWSSTPSHERWRVFIPTDVAMTHDVQKLIIEQIMRVLKARGFTDKITLTEIAAGGKQTNLRDHGFDSSKFNASSFFYAPCQANDPNGSFYDVYEGDRRHPLNVLSWIRNAIWAATDCIEAVTRTKAADIPPPKLPEEVRLTIESWSVTEADYVEKAIAKWRKTPEGKGHTAFLGLGRCLANAGFTKSQTRQKLWEEACYGHSPDERRNDIPDILKKVYSGKQGRLPSPKFGVKLKPVEGQEATTPLIVSLDHLPHAANSVCESVTMKCA